MKVEKNALYVAVAVLVLLSAIAFRLWSPVAWEYAIISPSDYELGTKLTEAGQDGWEIASARRALEDKTGVYEIILKRQVSIWHRKPLAQALVTTSGASSAASYTYNPPKPAAPVISYPAPDNPRAKLLLRACVNGKIVALEGDKWVPYTISGTRLQCVVEQ
jgi:hypothetical protein